MTLASLLSAFIIHALRSIQAQILARFFLGARHYLVSHHVRSMFLDSEHNERPSPSSLPAANCWCLLDNVSSERSVRCQSSIVTQKLWKSCNSIQMSLDRRNGSSVDLFLGNGVNRTGVPRTILFFSRTHRSSACRYIKIERKVIYKIFICATNGRMMSHHPLEAATRLLSLIYLHNNPSTIYMFPWSYLLLTKERSHHLRKPLSSQMCLKVQMTMVLKPRLILLGILDWQLDHQSSRSLVRVSLRCWNPIQLRI
jgi:hypothetical protein